MGHKVRPGDEVRAAAMSVAGARVTGVDAPKEIWDSGEAPPAGEGRPGKMTPGCEAAGALAGCEVSPCEAGHAAARMRSPGRA